MEEIRRRVAVAPIGAAHDIHAEDVVGRCQILITDLLCRLREFAYGGWITTNSDIERVARRQVSSRLSFPRGGTACPSAANRGLIATSAPSSAPFRRALMKIVRFAAAPDGGSQFVEIYLPV